MTGAKLTLDRQFEEIVSAIPAHQDLLDAAWSEDLREFITVWRLADAAGLGALARAVAPARLVTTNADLEIRLLMSVEQSTVMSVRLLALGLQKRYERTTQAHLEVRCRVTARPHARREGGDHG